MRDNDKASEVLIPIPLDRREACDRRRFIAGASAALAAVALTSRQAAAHRPSAPKVRFARLRLSRPTPGNQATCAHPTPPSAASASNPVPDR
jgi:hypothetical protein